jgi:MFS family permease
MTSILRRVTGGALWRHHDFRRVWLGETISQLGGQVTYLAFPLAGALLLHASPSEMGILGACGLLPYLVISLPAGGWIDRVRRRPVLVSLSFLLAFALLVVPIAYVLGVLSMPVLYLVALVTGTSGLVYDIAAQSYLPTLIAREDLVEGNSKLELSRSAAQVVGPGLGGALVVLVTAPIAILVDSVALLFSATMLLSIRTAEPAPRLTDSRPGLIREIREGLALVYANRILLSIAATMATYFFFDSMVQAVYILYVTRDLGMGADQVGLILAIGNVGFLPGALLAGRIGRRFGIGPTLILAIGTCSVFGLLAPLAAPALAFPMLVAARFGVAFGMPVFMINQISLRQSITPDRLLGRLTGTMKFVAIGVAPIGALAGGALGSGMGVHAAIGLAAAGTLAAVALLASSPVRHLRADPAPWQDDQFLALAAEAEIESATETRISSLEVRL